MLQNELSKADTEELNMHAVYDAEIEMVEEKTDIRRPMMIGLLRTSRSRILLLNWSFRRWKRRKLSKI